MSTPWDHGGYARTGPAHQTLRDLAGDTVWRELLAHGRTRHHTGGSLLLRQGDSGTHVLALISGVAKVVRSDPDGTTTLLAFRGPGDLLGEMAVLSDNTRLASVHTLSACTVAVLPSTTLQRFMSGHDLTPALMRHAFSRLHESDRARTGSHSLARLAATLVRIADLTDQAAESGPLELALTRDDLAQHLGMSRNTVTARLTALERWHVTTGRMRVILHDLPALRRLAAKAPG